MAAWFGKGRRDEDDAVQENPDEVSTGRIAAQVIAGAAGEGVASEPVTVPETQQATEIATAETAPPVARESDAHEQLRAERSTLIELCLYALDRARSGGVVERLVEGLSGVGVTAIRPEGRRFDPSVHEAGGTVPTTDGELDGIVAETEVVGFTDGDKLLRAPIVTVYAFREGGQQP